MRCSATGQKWSMIIKRLGNTVIQLYDTILNILIFFSKARECKGDLKFLQRFRDKIKYFYIYIQNIYLLILKIMNLFCYFWPLDDKICFSNLYKWIQFITTRHTFGLLDGGLTPKAFQFTPIYNSILNHNHGTYHRYIVGYGIK